MRHLGLWAAAGLLLSTGALLAQGSPFTVPQPQGGPIFHPDGRVMNGMEFEKTPYAGFLEGGLNGAEGNSKFLSLRLGGQFTYDTPDDFCTVFGWYGLNRDASDITQNMLWLTARNELMYDGTFGFFSQLQFEYDDLRVVDRRLGVHNGLSVNIIKDTDILLKARLGLGASQEHGGPENGWAPEGDLGGDFEWQLTKATKFVAGLDYYPDVSDFGHYRVRGRAAFEFMVDPKLNLSIRTGLLERYDSRPGDAKHNDLGYFVTLLYKF